MTLDTLRVGGAALNQTPLDWNGNRENIIQALRQAREAEVQVLCLPELCLTGYGCEDAFHGEWVARRALEVLLDLLPETRGLAAAVGLPVLREGQLFNCAALLADGRLAGFSAKRVLAGHGVYYEPRWFRPWPAGVMVSHSTAAGRVPFGDLLFDLSGVRLGFEICEDAWSRPQYQRGGAVAPDLLLNPSASHYASGKYADVRGIVMESSRLAHAGYLYANLLGNESGRLIFDGSVLVASDGRMLVENTRFSYRQVNLVTAVVDLEANRLERRRNPAPLSENDAELGKRVEVPFAPRSPTGMGLSPSRWNGIAFWEAQRTGASLNAERATGEPGGLSTWEGTAHVPLEESFLRAVSLGLWDYLRKSRQQGFALSLSGGVDSATVAVLVWAMTRLALAELGWEEFGRQLAHLTGLPQPEGPAEAAGSPRFVGKLVHRLLLTVYQATANSGTLTRAAARGVAEALGSRHLELEVQPLVAAYEGLAESALGRKLDWARDDMARQNIQARVRSPGIWLLANLEGLLLLSTSNRSEIGVGYATMDGDTSGGLAPIAGANKTFLRHWLRWMEREGLAELGPLPVLAAVNIQAPTAELRPPEQGQQDEKDLMPYVVLDVIEQAAIRDRLAPVAVWRRLRETPLPGITLNPRQAAEYVAHFFKRFSASQWKRERLAPSFHLDDENLDPRTWCRFPILAGGYQLELEALWNAVRSEGEEG